MNMAMAEKEKNMAFDVAAVRRDFPMLDYEVDGRPIAYLDSGATAQKPQAVIDRMTRFDTHEYATIHRGAYRLGEKATMAYEEARRAMARFLNAGSEKEIIFTTGATQSVNLVAYGWGRKFVGAGDEVLITEMEHHANIVPWQVLCEEKGATLKVAPVDDNGALIMERLRELVTEKTKMVAVTHVSNVLGTINPVEEITRLAHEKGAVVLVDGAQGAPHMPVDVQAIGCDFYVLSAHKMYGPTGVGLLYGRYQLLEEMTPYVTGGDMIEKVSFEKTTYARPPGKFEAGTPPITQAIGMAAAAAYLEKIGLDRAHAYEEELLQYGTALLDKIPGVRIIGRAKEKAAILSFVIDGVHPHDIVTLMDQEGLALRGGHHCAQPLMDRFSVPATARASLAFYNTTDELDRMAAAIKKIIEIFT